MIPEQFRLGFDRKILTRLRGIFDGSIWHDVFDGTEGLEGADQYFTEDGSGYSLELRCGHCGNESRVELSWVDLCGLAVGAVGPYEGPAWRLNIWKEKHAKRFAECCCGTELTERVVGLIPRDKAVKLLLQALGRVDRRMVFDWIWRRFG